MDVTWPAADASQAAVAAAIGQASDGDTVTIPKGASTWVIGVTVTKNISIIGAGEGITVITGNINTGTPQPVFNVNLTTELTAPHYSFRISGISFRSLSTTALYGTDKGFLSITGKTGLTAYQPGCVSRVRVDHIDAHNIVGLTFFFNSVIGVMDHCVSQRDSTLALFSYPMLVYDINWTPVGSTALRSNAEGSWEDDPYWGTDRALYIEDCNFSGHHNNVMDQLEGSRVVFRHNTCSDSLFVASHGMEGKLGLRTIEIYNNKSNITGGIAQLRSGNVICFNNVFTNPSNDLPLYNYRIWSVYANWGGGSGDNRYDTNDATNWGPHMSGGFFQGTVSRVTSAGIRGSFFDDSANAIDLFNAVQAGMDANDGYTYTVVNTHDPFTGDNNGSAPGWLYLMGVVASWNATTHEVVLEFYIDGSLPGSPASKLWSATWNTLDVYQVRRMSSMFGQPGSGKCAKFTGFAATNTVNDPQAATSHKEPSYCFNNWNTAKAAALVIKPYKSVKCVQSGRDFFNSTQTTSTQQIGYNVDLANYPTVNTGSSENNTHATVAYPSIVMKPADYPTTTQYTPLTYPHPLAGGTLTPAITSSTTTFLAGGPNADFVVQVQNFTARPNVWAVTSVDGVSPGTLPTNVAFNTSTGTFSGTATGATAASYNIGLSATYTPTTPDEVATGTFILKIQSPAQHPSNVAVTSPANLATFVAPGSIKLESSASDTDGTIASISYYHSSITLITTIDATITPAPWTYNWTGVGVGTYALTVKATDNDNLSTTSSSISVTVTPPTVLPPPTIVVSG